MKMRKRLLSVCLRFRGLDSNDALHIDLVASPHDILLVFANVQFHQFAVAVVDPCADQCTKNWTNARNPEVIVTHRENLASVANEIGEETWPEVTSWINWKTTVVA